MCNNTISSETMRATMKNENNLTSSIKEMFIETKSEFPICSLWAVKDDGIPSLPAFYPVEKSSRRIFGIIPSIIAARLVECAREMSLQAIYNSDSATAHFRSMDRVEMRVSLWKNRLCQTENNNGSSGVIVEVQRCEGDSVHFQKYSRQMLSAAAYGNGLHKDKSNNDNKRKMRDEVVQNILVGKKRKSERNSIHQNNKCLLDEDPSSVELILTMLESDQWDVQQLGMESLCHSTNTLKTDSTTAVKTSCAVLFGETLAEDGSFSDGKSASKLQDRIFSLIGWTEEPGTHGFQDLDSPLSAFPENGRSSFSDSSFSSFSLPPFVLMEQSHNNRMRSLALSVFANALDVLATRMQLLETELKSFSVESVQPKLQQNILHDNAVLETLFFFLSQAKSDPHDAYQSGRSIRSLCILVPIAASLCCQGIRGVHDAIVIALEVGRVSHAHLQGVAECLWKCIGSDENVIRNVPCKRMSRSVSACPCLPCGMEERSLQLKKKSWIHSATM